MAQLKATVFCSIVVAALVGWCGGAQATPVSFETPSGSTVSSGNNVSAEATFTASTNQITITLTNLEADIRDVGQNISGLTFGVSPAESSAALSSSSGTERTIISGGTFSDGSSVPTGWVLSHGSAGFFLDGLDGAADTPAHTIIGPPASTNLYSDANSSIDKETGPHNPFLEGDVQFTLSVPGVTAGTTIDNVVFSFGTTSGSDVNGVPVPNPEPATMALLLVGLPALLRRRRQAE